MTATPFVKCAGGKRKLVPRILEIVSGIPGGTFRYREPFVGGGAVFFALAASGRLRAAYLSDLNADLVAAWQAVQTDPEGLISRLRRAKNTREHYEKVRERDSSRMGILERGARFVYLNKTAYSGLWRVNRAGRMNAPFGSYPKPLICDAENIRAAADVLRKKGVAIAMLDFEHSLEAAKKGDLVYLDPPYEPVRKTGTRSFTGYTKEGFGPKDQERLRDLVLDRAKAGVSIILSNSSAPEVEELYEDPARRGRAHRLLTVERVHMTRTVNSKAGERGEVPEILVTANVG